MNAREHLQMIIHENKYATSGTIAYESSAALRELDQLLIDMADCLLHNVERRNYGPSNSHLREIEKRLVQAGYGEK